MSQPSASHTLPLGGRDDASFPRIGVPYAASSDDLVIVLLRSMVPVTVEAEGSQVGGGTRSGIRPSAGTTMGGVDTRDPRGSGCPLK